MAEFNEDLYKNVLANNNKLNLIGVIKKYFQLINNNDVCNEQTRKTYISNYEKQIFPLIKESKSVEDYTEADLLDLAKKVVEVNDLAVESIKSRYNHLVFDPVYCYYKDPSNNAKNPFVGTAHSFEEKHKNDIDSAYLKIPKSLSPKQQKAICDYLLSNYETDDGYLLGLAIMFFLGTRENEAAGASFRNISNLDNLDQFSTLMVVETTEYKKSSTKISGKTDNAFRRIPIIDVFKQFLLKRKAFVSMNTFFPVIGSNGELIECVDDLPIACVGDKYFKRCSSDYLGIKGKEFLMNIIGIEEETISGIDSLINNKEEFVDYKDPTTYLLRRSFLTNLYLIGLTDEQIEYIAGHKMEDSDLTRGMFGSEENLLEIYDRLNRLPMNSINNITLIKPNSDYCMLSCESDIIINGNNYNMLSIKEIQNGDPVSIQGLLNGQGISVSPESNNQPMLINLTKQFINEYKK